MLASILKLLFEAVKMWFACLAGHAATADEVAHFGARECETLSPLEQRAGIVLLMMTRAVEGQQRLISVLLAGAAMPPLLASRVWIDFRHTGGSVYVEKVLELARVLRDERPGSPLRPDQVQPPSGTGFRAEGPMHYRLQVYRHTVHLLGGPEAVQQPARALDATLERRL